MHVHAQKMLNRVAAYMLAVVRVRRCNNSTKVDDV
jgi:hypothetical protein